MAACHKKSKKKSKAETRFLAIFFICTRLMGKPAVPLKFATDCIFNQNVESN